MLVTTSVACVVVLLLAVYLSMAFLWPEIFS